jgi:hypothetical protein
MLSLVTLAGALACHSCLWLAGDTQGWVDFKITASTLLIVKR